MTGRSPLGDHQARDPNGVTQAIWKARTALAEGWRWIEPETLRISCGWVVIAASGPVDRDVDAVRGAVHAPPERSLVHVSGVLAQLPHRRALIVLNFPPPGQPRRPGAAGDRCHRRHHVPGPDPRPRSGSRRRRHHRQHPPDLGRPRRPSRAPAAGDCPMAAIAFAATILAANLVATFFFDLTVLRVCSRSAWSSHWPSRPSSFDAGSMPAPHPGDRFTRGRRGRRHDLAHTRRGPDARRAAPAGGGGQPGLPGPTRCPGFWSRSASSLGCCGCGWPAGVADRRGPGRDASAGPFARPWPGPWATHRSRSSTGRPGSTPCRRRGYAGRARRAGRQPQRVVPRYRGEPLRGHPARSGAGRGPGSSLPSPRRCAWRSTSRVVTARSVRPQLHEVHASRAGSSPRATPSAGAWNGIPRRGAAAHRRDDPRPAPRPGGTRDRPDPAVRESLDEHRRKRGRRSPSCGNSRAASTPSPHRGGRRRGGRDARREGPGPGHGGHRSGPALDARGREHGLFRGVGGTRERREVRARDLCEGLRAHRRVDAPGRGRRRRGRRRRRRPGQRHPRVAGSRRGPGRPAVDREPSRPGHAGYSRRSPSRDRDPFEARTTP